MLVDSNSIFEFSNGGRWRVLCLQNDVGGHHNVRAGTSYLFVLVLDSLAVSVCILNLYKNVNIPCISCKIGDRSLSADRRRRLPSTSSFLLFKCYT